MRVKNWADFQHYKDRSPPWIKLHKALLDDYDFQCLPIASRALAPMLWLLASENMEGEITEEIDRLAFRLRWSKEEVASGLKPLLDKGFVISDSAVLASCYQGATPETEAEAYKPETEKRAPTARFDPKAHLMAKGIDDSLAADWITLRRAKKAPPTEAAISGIEREADKARISLADALSLCCQRGWAGFKSEWALQTPGGGRGATQAQTNKEITARAILGSLLDGFQQPTEKLISQNTGE